MSKKNERERMLDQLSQGGDDWENGKYGESLKHAKVASKRDEKSLDDALGLQLISIRLNKSLIEQFKRFAALEATGYQPFIRKVLEDYEIENRHRLDKPYPQSRDEIDALVRERDTLLEEVKTLKQKNKARGKRA